MIVFNQNVVVTKQSDGSFTISVAVSDVCVITKTVSRGDLDQLRLDIEEVLK